VSVLGQVSAMSVLDAETKVLPEPLLSGDLIDNPIVVALPKALVGHLSDLPSVIRTLCDKHELLEKQLKVVLDRAQLHPHPFLANDSFDITPRKAGNPDLLNPRIYSTDHESTGAIVSGIALVSAEVAPSDVQRGSRDGARPSKPPSMPKDIGEILLEEPTSPVLSPTSVKPSLVNIAAYQHYGDDGDLAITEKFILGTVDAESDSEDFMRPVDKTCSMIVGPENATNAEHDVHQAHQDLVHSMRETKKQHDKINKARRVRDARSQYGEPDSWRYNLARLVINPLFDSVCACVILLNSLLIGITTEYRATTHAADEEFWMRVCGYICAAYFLVELLARIALHGRMFFSTEDKAWNIFDFILVTFSLIDVAMEQLTQGGGSSVGSAMKTVKMLRIIRIFRVFRFFSELSVLALMITDSLKSLMWALVMLSLIIYVFAICFTSGATEWLIGQGGGQSSSNETLKAVRVRFGSLSRSVNSLVLSMLGGVNWGEISGPLENIGWVLVGLFFFYIFFTMFAVLNIITGVFVDNAVQTANSQREFLVEKEMEVKESYLTEMRSMFAEMDEDESGTISVDEITEFFEDDRMRFYFQVLGIDAADCGRLFKLLDEDGSGEVEIEEFLGGCLRLKGNARSIDVHGVMFQLNTVLNGVNALAEFHNISLKKIVDGNGDGMHAPVDDCTPVLQAAPRLSSRASPVHAHSPKIAEV